MEINTPSSGRSVYLHPHDAPQLHQPRSVHSGQNTREAPACALTSWPSCCHFPVSTATRRSSNCSFGLLLTPNKKSISRKHGITKHAVTSLPRKCRTKPLSAPPTLPSMTGRQITECTLNMHMTELCWAVKTQFHFCFCVQLKQKSLPASHSQNSVWDANKLLVFVSPDHRQQPLWEPVAGVVWSL